MERFDYEEELSEDWISLPRSSGASLKSAVISKSSISPSKSRIPRATPGFSKGLIGSRVSIEPAIGNALQEKTASAVNSPEHGKARHRSVNRRSSSTFAKLPAKNRRASTSSLPSMSLGTVQQRHHNAYGDVDGAQENVTPDWKRRVLDGKSSVIAKTDLFSPMKLENVFQPPPEQHGRSSGSPQRRGKIYQENHQFPSSPPPYPASRVSASSSAPTVIPASCSQGYRLSTAVGRSEQCTAGLINRTTSHSSAVQHEAISPVSIPRGHINCKHAEGIKRRSLDARSASRFGCEKCVGETKTSAFADDTMDPPDLPLNETTSHSLPEYGSERLIDLDAEGINVTTRRGGFSTDGSFLNRSLSATSFRPSDAMVQSSALGTIELGLNSMNRAGVVKESIPKTPTRNASNSLGRSRSSGSPLKLFENYDTFTNDRLVRRMSQFEGSYHSQAEDSWKAGQRTVATASPYRKSQVRQASDPSITPPEHEQASRASSFGAGGFDDFAFSHRQVPQGSKNEPLEFSAASKPSEGKAYSGMTMVDVEITVPRDAAHLKRSLPNSKHRSKSQHSPLTTSNINTETTSDTWHDPISKFQTGDQAIADSKRALNTPIKSRSPKRRRTIYDDDELHMTVTVEDAALIPSTPTVAGRKRKDARYDSHTQSADPNIIANRRMLRPRARQSSRDHRPSLEQEDESTSAPPNSQSPHAEAKLVDVPFGTDDPLAADPINAFTANEPQGVAAGSRKPSVTTADYLMEANLIMENIRARALARPRTAQTSGQNSGEASEVDQLAAIDESSNEGSTKEEFSRPPSRETMSLPRQRKAKVLDPRVISHLRKFEEPDDLPLGLSSSLQMMNLNASATAAERVESDLPNVRIRNAPCDSLNQWNPVPSVDHAISRSDHSSNPSTARSAPTGSSNSSGSRAVIKPEVVSHLISDHVAGMTFDHARKLWLKKPSKISVNHHDLESELTEDDPLRDIPDLRVDRETEAREAEAAAAQRSIDLAQPAQSQWKGQEYNTMIQSSGTQPAPPAAPMDVESSALSRYSRVSRFASSGAKPDTRATSWGDEPPQIKNRQSWSAQLPAEPAPAAMTEHEDEVEHEISIFEGRESREPIRPSSSRHQARVVTVAFSSPLIHSHNDFDAAEEDWSGESDLDLSESPPQDGPQQRQPSGRRYTPGYGSRSTYRTARRLSIGSQGYVVRPISTIDESDEAPFLNVAETFNQSMDVAIATPRPPQSGNQILAAAPLTSDQSSRIMFHLSPLPDFTVHQDDEAHKLDVDCSSKHRGLLAKQDIKENYSLAIKDLVSKITDIEPYEPYWEYVRKLELRDKSLLTLHLLDEFCPRIEELDVSGNELGQLHGIPISLRLLDASNNCLTNLTAWGHLHNLQYIDVSGNQIQSLKPFGDLAHLRELKADDNNIEDIRGLSDLTGLLRLSVRHNQVKQLDLQGSHLYVAPEDLDTWLIDSRHRLQDLDLQGNQITTVSHLNRAPSLLSLNLAMNHLESLDFEHSGAVAGLVQLDISDNRLSMLNVAPLTSLRQLQVDCNKLAALPGTELLEHLADVTWRNQRAPDDQLDLSGCRDAHGLSLSNNRLHSLSLQSSFLNLQRLELAFCGLEALPHDFDLRMPNIRILNLNHNAIKDIRPLLGNSRVKELHLAGNRLSRLRRTVAVVERLGSSLHTLDLRQNPLTLGFYPVLAPRTENAATDLIRQPEKTRCHHHHYENHDQAAPTTKHAVMLHLLPPGHRASDERYRSTLDDDTRLRRKVYEMLILKACAQLRRLDGLAVADRSALMGDEAWARLVELGVIKEKNREAGA